MVAVNFDDVSFVFLAIDFLFLCSLKLFGDEFQNRVSCTFHLHGLFLALVGEQGSVCLLQSWT